VPVQSSPLALPPESCVVVRRSGAAMQSVPPWNGAALGA
jgi:hypothetical protein